MMQRSGGFSLVELGIVLVIIGLLVGGIVTGQNFIRKSEIHSVMAQAETYKAATRIFKEKYMELPGDFSDAEFQWGTAHATDATCKTTNSLGLRTTCDGDGNGRIEIGAVRANEPFRFWQHLSNAGLVEGNYSGVEGSAGNMQDVVAGVNAPATSMGENVVMYPIHYNQTGVSASYRLNFGNCLKFGLDTITAGAIESGALTPKELYSLDMKFDDGKPAMGVMIAEPWNSCGIGGATNADLNSDYNMNEKRTVCIMRLRNWFDAQ